MSPKDFTRLVAVELERLEKSEGSKPRRNMLDGFSAARLRNSIRIKALKGEKTGYWMSDEAGRWAVGYDESPDGEFSSGGQIIRVKGFKKLSDTEGILRKMRGLASRGIARMFSRRPQKNR